MAAGILILGLLYFLAHGFTAMFERTRIPDVFLLMVLGILAGPVFGVLSLEDFGRLGPLMTTLALIVILFDSGARLRLTDIRVAVRDIAFLGGASFVVTMVLATLIARGLGWLDWPQAVMLGAAIGGSSSAVVIPMARQLGVREPTATMLVGESALTDVLCIVALFATVQAWREGVVSVGGIAGSVAATLGLAMVLGVAGAAAWLLFLRMVRRYPNTLSTTLGFALVLYGLTEFAGYSGPIAVLAFGIALANQRELRLHRVTFADPNETTITREEHAFHGELVFIFKIFFFVYLGLAVRFSPGEAALAILVTAAAFLARLLLTRLLLSRKAVWSDAAVTSFMIPKGLAAAVIAAIPLAAGVPGGEVIEATVYQVVFLSILVTVVLVPLGGRPGAKSFYQRFFRTFAPEPPAEVPAPEGNPAVA